MPNGHDKNWVRVCAAIDGFRVRYGRWPTRVRIFPASLANIYQLFSQADRAKIDAKLTLVADEALIVAEDDLGGSYSYGQEGFPSARLTPSANDWLDVQPNQINRPRKTSCTHRRRAASRSAPPKK